MCCAVALSFCASGAAAVYCVRTDGNDASSGLNWAQAKRTISNALGAAQAGDQVWVASGIYIEKITLPPGVQLYGGFAGVNETNLTQRDWINNLSVLNLNVTNGPLVTITNAGPETRVDGMVLTGGAAGAGAGVCILGAGPVIANNRIYLNSAGAFGGGIYVGGWQTFGGQERHAIITNNLVVNNHCPAGNACGGGIVVRGASPTIAWNVISRNSAGLNGGGIAIYCARDGMFPIHSKPVITNNYIVANTASRVPPTTSGNNDGGGGGGVYSTALDPSTGLLIPGAIAAPVIINNVIAANGAMFGAGVKLDVSPNGASTVANNTVVANSGVGIFWKDTALTNCNNLVAYNWAGMMQNTNPMLLANNNVYGNKMVGIAADYLGMADPTGINGNLSMEPRLADYRVGDFHIQPGSPCIDAGRTGEVGTGLDLDGAPRVVNGRVDIGAYESSGVTSPTPARIILVSPSGDDAADGLSWATAKQTVQAGVDAAAGYLSGGEVWVAGGSYTQHLSLSAFTHVYGGFSGSETNREARNPSAYATILDGGGTPGVVFFEHAGYLVCTLDGFTVQNGGRYTGGVGSPATNVVAESGGGLRIHVGSPIIANNLIRLNSVGVTWVTQGDAYGAGIYGYLCHGLITGNTLTQNEAINFGGSVGGGIACLFSYPFIERNFLCDNHAKDGAAIYVGLMSAPRIAHNAISNHWHYASQLGERWGAATLDGCSYFIVEGNTIISNRSGHLGAGVCVLNAASGGVLQNNLVLGNVITANGGSGAGLYCNLTDTATNSLLVINNTFVGNRADAGITDNGGAMTIESSCPRTNALIVANNIMVSNSSGIYLRGTRTNQMLLSNCLLNRNLDYGGLSGLAPGVGDIHVWPQFVSPGAGNFRLLSTSPCIDAAQALYVPGDDSEGTLRPLDGDNDSGAAPDIGAYEFVHPLADTDRDGMLDQAEVVAGTCPTNPSSVLKLRSRSLDVGRAIALSWPSMSGRTYAIHYRPALTGVWLTLTNNIPGCDTLMEVQDCPVGTCFYRLQVQRN